MAQDLDSFEPHVASVEGPYSPARTYPPGVYANAIEHREKMAPPPGLKVDSPAAGARWEFVGPLNYAAQPPGWACSGRVNAVCFDPLQNGVWYLGAPYGGVWKTTDFGATWKPLSDNWKFLSVSSIAVDPVNSDNIYVGTGDVPNPGAGYALGVMKSTDGGLTWTPCGVEHFGNSIISQVVVDPDDPTVVFAAVFGGQVWRSADAGSTWTAVLPYLTWLGVAYGATPGLNGPRAYYAIGEGLSGTLFRSDDLGITWEALQTPLSNVGQQRPLVAASPVFPDTLYLFSPTDKKIFKGQNFGQTWVDVSGNWTKAGGTGQPLYNFCLACSYVGDPSARTAVDVVYFGMLFLNQSVTGGPNWTLIEGVTNGHSDQHAIAVDPRSPNFLLVGNDGGVFLLTYVPEESTTTVDTRNKTLGITQLWSADYAPNDPTNILAGAQDVMNPASLGDLDNWTNVGGGDGGTAVINPTTPSIQYTQTNFNNPRQMQLRHTIDKWVSQNDIQHALMKTELRGLAAPMFLDPNQPEVLYVATNYLYRWHENWGGGAWEASIAGSPHLGSPPKTGQLLSATGYVNAIGVAPTDSLRIYTGSNDNEVWMSTDGGTTWSRIDAGLPQDGGITSLSVNPTDSRDILVGLWKTSSSSHLWRCHDTDSVPLQWVDVSGPSQPNSLPPGIPIDAITRDPFDPVSSWYVGTDIGVFATDDAGADWYNLTQPLGLPNAPAQVKAVPITNYLYAHTYGRGIWRLKLGPSPPGPPTNVLALWLATGQVIVTWTGGANTKHFEVKCSGTATSADVMNADSPFVDTNFPPDVDYATLTMQYQVIAHGDFGLSSAAAPYVLNPAVLRLTLDSPTVVGGLQDACTVVISNTFIPAAGLKAALWSSLPQVATVPNEIMLVSGVSASFPIATAAVTQDVYVQLRATVPILASTSTDLTVEKLIPPGAIRSVTTSADGGAVPFGGKNTGEIVIAAPLSSQEVTVLLRSTQPATAAVQASVVIPAGQASASFPITIAAKSPTGARLVVVTIFGSAGGLTAETSFTVGTLPPPPHPPGNLQ